MAARLIFINQPYIDHWSWRQSDVAAIARNFLLNGFRFGDPQIDWAGNAPGYVGTEFPILPFVAALCYKVAGVHEWTGRIQAVILFAISLLFFFLLVRKLFGSVAAAWATFFFSFTPLNIFAGRSFMPDVPSLSFAIIGLYFFLRWVERRGSWSFFVAAIVISLSFLIKITSIVIVVPLVYLAVSGGGALGSGDRGRRPRLQFALFGDHCPGAVHYLVLARVSNCGEILSPSFLWRRRDSNRVFIVVLAHCATNVGSQSYAGSHSDGDHRLVCSAVARSRYSRLFHWWLVAMIVFIVVAGYGNRHRWYQLPLVPIAAAFAGAGCAFIGSRISSRLSLITSSIVLAVTFVILAFVYVRPFYQSSAAQLRDAGVELKKVTPPDALIVAADMGDPTVFYYAERKGWHFLEQDAIYNGNPDDSEQAIKNLERLQRAGATHFVFTRNTFWWTQSYPEFAAYLTNNATLIKATPEFEIYTLATGAR